MVDVDAFDLKSDLPKFLESFLQKAESILQDVEKQNLDAEVLAEAVDQTISLIQTLQEPGEIQPLDIVALNSLAGTFTKCTGVVMKSHFFVERKSKTDLHRLPMWFLWLHHIIKCLRVTFLLLQACLSEIYLFCRI